MKYSVIIPVLNEAANIEDCIEHVRGLDPGVEIIVADGGSADDTVARTAKYDVTVAQSGPGRGVQCNAGAALAGGDILVFLHADTRLPEDAFEQLETYFNRPEVNIGTFRLSFDINHWLLRLYILPCEIDLPFNRFGDQCIAVRRSFFIDIGGFPSWRLFEDLGLVNRARCRTRIYRFPGRVQTSARRFLRNGIVRQQFRNMWLTLKYFLGVSPEKLSEQYQRTLPDTNAVSLGVFVRLPHPGRVKSRLALELGEAGAAEFYRLCAERAFDACRRLVSKARLTVFFDNPEDLGPGSRWAGPYFDAFSQTEGDLGQRLVNAFGRLFGDGARQAIILASDVPDISGHIIRRAAKSLDRADVVIGPCPDGGYYLIGIKGPHPELFKGIDWSTGQVYRQTKEAIAVAGLSLVELPELADIDTGEDLERWLRETPEANQQDFRRFLRKQASLPVGGGYF